MAAINLPVPGSDFNTWGEKLNETIVAVNAQGDPATVAAAVATDIATPDSAIETALTARYVEGQAQSETPVSPEVGYVWVDTGSTVPVPVTPTNALLIAADSFTRADSATTLGSPTFGPAWQALLGTWGITGNNGYLASGAGGVNNAAAIDTGSSDHIVQAKFVVSGAPGLGVRITDSDNGFVSNLTNLYKRVAGSYPTNWSYSTAFAIGDTQRIVAHGTSIKVYRQAASAGAFAEVLSITDSFNLSGTKVCVRSSTTARIDDFLAYAVVPA